MKTKKCGVYAALAAVLLITAMLVITCTEPLTPGGITVPQKGEREVFVPPPGKGYIIVNLPTEAGRTILPAAPTIESYKVEIVNRVTTGNSYDETDTTAAPDYDNFGTGNKEIFVVDNGTYDVTVFGLTDTNVIVAAGESGTAGVQVSSGVGAVTITLKEIVKSGQNGTLVYTPSLPTGFTTANPTAGTATATAEVYPDGASTTLTSGNNTLESGYYWVKVVLSKAKYETVTHTQIVHIYAGQISTWAPTLTMNKNAYDVTYDENGADTPASPVVVDSGTGGLGWTHAQPITLNAAYDADDSGADPSKSGYQFLGWYTADTGGAKWAFGTSGTLLYRDRTLYAQYEEIPAGGLNITIVPYVHPGEKVSLSSSSVTFTHDEAKVTGGPTINVAVAPNPFDANTFGWYFGDTEITDTTTLTTTDILSKTSINFSVSGSYKFSFRGKIGAAAYDATYTVTVSQELP